MLKSYFALAADKCRPLAEISSGLGSSGRPHLPMRVPAARALLRVAASRLADAGRGVAASSSSTPSPSCAIAAAHAAAARAFSTASASRASPLGSAPVPAIARRLYLPPGTSSSARGVSSSAPGRPLTSSPSARPASPSPAVPAPAAPAPPVDGMPRYPNLTVPGLLRASDYFGTAVFALTGTLAAAARGMDILGCTIVGTITAVGGGTVRDILLGGGRRAFWMEEIEYLFICVGVSAATFLAWPRLEAAFGVRETDEWVDWADALGVGAFCVIGAQNGIRAGVPCAAAVACGMFTATFGGVVRDVLCARPVRVLHSYADVYATTALAGATTYVLIRAAGAPVAFRILGGMGTAVALRKCAWTDDWRLPVYAGAEPNVAGGVRGGAAAARRKGDDGTGTRPPFAAIAESVMDAVGLTSPPPVEPTRWRGWFGRG